MAEIRKVCVYCASSGSAHPDFYAAAQTLGRVLASAGITVVYGGSSNGCMGALAESALDAGGEVIGVIPHFMQALEWAHGRLTKLHLVEDMHQRKRMMMDDVDAAIALPGGCGTLEELFEVMSLKRLGLFLKPIVLVNVRGFYDDCDRLLRRCVVERFMDTRHLSMWTTVDRPEDVIDAIRTAHPWDDSAKAFAIS